MARLRPSVCALVLVAGFIVPPEAQASLAVTKGSSIDRWRSYIAEASARFGVPEEWIRRVMRAESGGRTELNGRPIVSRAGAMGLMQLMPATWAEMRRAHDLGPDPHAPRDNIIAGTAYLRAMYDRFGYPGLFGAYNAGPQRYGEHLSRRRPLPGETRAYMAAVAGGEVVSASDHPVTLVRPTPPALFATLKGRETETASASIPPRPEPSGLLFVQLRTASSGSGAPGDRR
jgi:hypothetical protein